MPATRPLISVLMPVYRAEPFLAECLDSVRAQSLADWELIAVDDQSPDGSREILQAYAAREARLRCFVNPRKGLIPALRLARRQARGAFITRMDADDRMSSQKLEALYRAVSSAGPRTLALGQVAYFSDGELGAGYRRYAQWLNRLVAERSWGQGLYRECVVPSPCWMTRAEDLDYCGAFSSDRYPEDYDLCFRFFAASLRFVGVEQVLHHWRDHSERASRTQSQYADNSFLELKVDWFLRLERDHTRPLVVWGAGERGKTVAGLLHRHRATFTWITDNPAKQGKHIYGQLLYPSHRLTGLIDPQILVLVSAPEEQAIIRFRLKSRGWQEGLHFFFFI